MTDPEHESMVVGRLVVAPDERVVDYETELASHCIATWKHMTKSGELIWRADYTDVILGISSNWRMACWLATGGLITSEAMIDVPIEPLPESQTPL
jgi:hypothetical protein